MRSRKESQGRENLLKNHDAHVTGKPRALSLNVLCRPKLQLHSMLIHTSSCREGFDLVKVWCGSLKKLIGFSFFLSSRVENAGAHMILLSDGGVFTIMPLRAMIFCRKLPRVQVSSHLHCRHCNFRNPVLSAVFGAFCCIIFFRFKRILSNLVHSGSYFLC